MGAQNYNSATKFLQNEGCSSPNFVVLKENFPTGLKLDGHNATDNNDDDSKIRP